MPSITCAGSSREMQANSGEPGVARIRDRSQDGPVRGCEQPTKTDCVIGATKDLHSLDKTPVREHLRYSSDCCHRVPQWRKPVPGYFGRHWKLLIRPACDGSGRGDIKMHGIQAVVREHTADPGQRRQPPVESNGQQRRSDSMASDIDHAERDLVIVRRDDVERVAGQFHRDGIASAVPRVQIADRWGGSIVRWTRAAISNSCFMCLLTVSRSVFAWRSASSAFFCSVMSDCTPMKWVR